MEASISTKLNLPHKETNYHHYILLSGPFIALIGNAASEIWLCIVAVYFLLHSASNKSWEWLREPWLIISLIFWFWLIITSFLSNWPENALSQSLPWIRFPIFAMAMSTWLIQCEHTSKRMLYCIFYGAIIMGLFLLIERIFDPYATRLYGTWGQNPKAGWYMLGIGLPVILLSLNAIYKTSSNYIWSIPIIILIFGTTVATGEVYITISMLFAILLYILISRSYSLPLILLMVLSAIIAIIVLSNNDYVSNRYLGTFISRLPWVPTSDYYSAWIGGLNTGLNNPFIGIGANNYQLNCLSLNPEELKATLGVKECKHHPHNIYIQTFAETGSIGLMLFIVLGISLLKEIRLSGIHKNDLTQNLMALTILVTVLWPISTYSQAFGQHKNMFTWFMIAFALFLISPRKDNHKV